MKMSRRAFALSLVPALSALSQACSPHPATPAASTANTAAPGIDLAGMNTSVKPGDDFFSYANGGWFKKTEIPADRSSWSTFGALDQLTSQRVSELIKGAASAAPATDARRVGDFYTAFLDEAGIEKRGIEPLKPGFARIAAIKTKTELATELGRQLLADVDAINNTDIRTDRLFGLWVEQDFNDTSRYAPYLMQGGIGLPDRDYFLSASPKMVEIRTAYQAHLVTVAKLLNTPDAEAVAKRVYDLEVKIAKVHAPRSDTGDVLKANNPWPLAEFAKRAPGLDWTAYFAAAGLAGQTQVIVWHPKAAAGEAGLVASEPLQTWIEYLTLRHAEHFATVLPKAFADENFAFNEKVLSGTPEQAPRWKRAVTATNAALGEAVGKLYVDKYFPAESKTKVQAMVSDIIEAFRVRIDALEWMAPETKAEAKRKLAVLKVGVGYPDKWTDYGALKVAPDDAFGNLERAEAFKYKTAIGRFGQPIDRGEWVMFPQTVNAVNLPVKNALNFPAAILQAPNFDPRNPPAVNYGAIGATIGHEISHSFDDQGAQFDSQGKLRDWWTPADLAHFKASGKALADQYDKYQPFPDLNVRGQQVLGENIADLAGLTAAYDAYRKAAGGEGKTEQGLTGDQQFFIAFGQNWRNKTREAALRQRVITDGHAPAEYRADTARNIDAWYAAFKPAEGEKLYLAADKRVKVW